jgi:hypothetical protein
LDLKILPSKTLPFKSLPSGFFERRRTVELFAIAVIPISASACRAPALNRHR